MTITTHDLFGLAVRLYDDGTVRAEERRIHGDLPLEMHPEADEAVYVLAGACACSCARNAPAATMR
jgi:hypothetical protein